MRDDRPDRRSALKLMLRHMNGHWSRFSLAAFLAICSAACEVFVSWTVWQALILILHQTDLIRAAPDTAFTVIALSALAAVIGQQVFFGFSTAVSHLVAFDVLAEIRNRLGEVWVRVPVGTLARKHSASAKTIAIDHCEKLELFFAHALPETIASVVVWFAITVWLLAVNPWLTLATVFLLPFAVATMLYAMRSNSYRMGEWVRIQTAMNAAIVDFLSALPVIRTFHCVGDSQERTATAIRQNANIQSEWGKAFVRWGSPFSTLIVSGLAIIVPVGTWLLRNGQVSPEELCLFFIIGPFYTVPLVKIFYRSVTLPLLAQGAQAITAELEHPYLESTDGTLVCRGDIVFDAVSFSYDPAIPVLRNISCRIPAGKTTALVGPSGSGKTTLAELILGFHPVTDGVITFGGCNIDALNHTALYQQISVVFQQPMLRAGSIKDNLTLAEPNASDAQCAKALEAAQLSDVIAALPHGINTELGEAGEGLSGGQKQRLALARALLANRPIVILDEPTAAADPDTELALQQGIHSLLHGKTCLIIAHRLRTIVTADQILVLDQGRIVETGTHVELLAAGGRYAEMWSDHTAATSLTLRKEKKH